VPIAGFAHRDGQALILRGLVADVNGQRILRSEQRGQVTEAAALGQRVAEELLAQGAQEILNTLQH
jgi:hydroxymethylbilane synthase